MSNLTNVYRKHFGSERTQSRLYVGLSGFALGLMLLSFAVIAATTNIAESLFGVVTNQVWEFAGITGGIGVQLMALGVYTILPTHRVQRNVALYVTVGTLLALFGIFVFTTIFPTQWVGDTPNNTWMVAITYLPGSIITFGSIFYTGIAYKIRNSPGGTVSMKKTFTVTQENTESEPVTPPMGSSAGMAGVPVDEEPQTETSGSEVIRDDEPQSERGPDEYCGNCSHFKYKNGVTPYCGLHDEEMADLEACNDWEVNTDSETRNVDYSDSERL